MLSGKGIPFGIAVTIVCCSIVRPAAGQIQSSYLGVVAQDLTPSRIAALHLHNRRGVEVLSVDNDSPAARAGFKPHDVIVKFNESTVHTLTEFVGFIRGQRIGPVSFGIVRNEVHLSLTAEIIVRTLNAKEEADEKSEDFVRAAYSRCEDSELLYLMGPFPQMPIACNGLLNGPSPKSCSEVFAFHAMNQDRPFAFSADLDQTELTEEDKMRGVRRKRLLTFSYDRTRTRYLQDGLWKDWSDWRDSRLMPSSPY